MHVVVYSYMYITYILVNFRILAFEFYCQIVKMDTDKEHYFSEGDILKRKPEQQEGGRGFSSQWASDLCHLDSISCCLIKSEMTPG